MRSRLALALPLLLVAACYTRVPIAGRARPSSARVAVRFDVDPRFVEAAREQAKAAALELDPKLRAAAEQHNDPSRIGDLLAARVRADLLDKNFARPVQGEDADLFLSGTFAAGPGGVELTWTLADPRGDAVAAGVASDRFFTGNIEPFADQILVKLATLDLDRLAGKSAAPAPAPGPAVAVPGEPPASATDGSKAFAVIVGIEKYREALPAASFAEEDARAFAAVAEKTLGVPPAHVKLLLGERAGRADLASALEEWLPRNAREPGGTVYVFFSGHGAPDTESGETYLVPYDADPAYLKTRGYAVKDLYAALGKLPGQRSLVFLDACFSGGGERSVLAAGTRPLVPVVAAGPKAGVISFAAASARETTGAALAGGHGLFTHHLLTALGGAADANADRGVTLAELVAHVTDRVAADARLQNREQRPVLTASGVDPAAVPVVVGLRP